MIKEAQNRLKILERQQQQHVNTAVQRDLFAPAVQAEPNIIERVVEVEKVSPALEILKALDVDNLTPREALQHLYQLKEQLES